MSDLIKVIKVEGQLKNLKEYDEDLQDAFRVYKNVTIIDKEGDELFFQGLVIPTRIDDEISNGEQLIFYMSRLKIKDKYLGSIFSTDNGKDKRFYPKEAKKSMEALAQNSTWRGRLLTNSPQLFVYVVGAWVIPIGLFAILLKVIFGVTGDSAMTMFGWIYAASFVWMFWPIFDKSNSGFKEAQATMEFEGFRESATGVKPNGLEKY